MGLLVMYPDSVLCTEVNFRQIRFSETHELIALAAELELFIVFCLLVFVAVGRCLRLGKIFR